MAIDRTVTVLRVYGHLASQSRELRSLSTANKVFVSFSKKNEFKKTWGLVWKSHIKKLNISGLVYAPSPSILFPMLNTPIFITNFKNYEQATGQNAVKLAEIHQKVAEDTGASIAVAVNPIDLYRVKQAVQIPVFAQHVDPIDYGSFTGHTLPQALKKAGAIGTLLNHSERRLDVDILTNALACAQKASLVRILCAESPEEAETLIQLDPDFLAFEPPELIGNSSKSVASEEPDSIKKVVEGSTGIPIIVGAGINCPEDIKVSLKLGAKGFLVASAVVKSRNPEKALREFINAF